MFKLYKKVFEQGIDLQFGKLTLCDLTHYRHNTIAKGGRRYQIYCDDTRCKFYKNYYERELDDAINKFIEIMEKIRPEVR